MEALRSAISVIAAKSKHFATLLGDKSRMLFTKVRSSKYVVKLVGYANAPVVTKTGATTTRWGALATGFKTLVKGNILWALAYVVLTKVERNPSGRTIRQRVRFFFADWRNLHRRVFDWAWSIGTALVAFILVSKAGLVLAFTFLGALILGVVGDILSLSLGQSRLLRDSFTIRLVSIWFGAYMTLFRLVAEYRPVWVERFVAPSRFCLCDGFGTQCDYHRDTYNGRVKVYSSFKDRSEVKETADRVTRLAEDMLTMDEMLGDLEQHPRYEQIEEQVVSLSKEIDDQLDTRILEFYTRALKDAGHASKPLSGSELLDYYEVNEMDEFAKIATELQVFDNISDKQSLLAALDQDEKVVAKYLRKIEELWLLLGQRTFEVVDPKSEEPFTPAEEEPVVIDFNKDLIESDPKEAGRQMRDQASKLTPDARVKFRKSLAKNLRQAGHEQRTITFVLQGYDQVPARA